MMYPELEKMKAARPRSQIIGEFLEWLDEQGIRLMTPLMVGDRQVRGEYELIHSSKEALLAKYFEIDMDEVEKERQLLLEEIRK